MGAAVSVSRVPDGKVSLQSLLWLVPLIEQLIPLPLTVPVPPLLVAARTVTVYVGGGGGGGGGGVTGSAKLAWTFSA